MWQFNAWWYPRISSAFGPYNAKRLSPIYRKKISSEIFLHTKIDRDHGVSKSSKYSQCAHVWWSINIFGVWVLLLAESIFTNLYATICANRFVCSMLSPLISGDCAYEQLSKAPSYKWEMTNVWSWSWLVPKCRTYYVDEIVCASLENDAMHDAIHKKLHIVMNYYETFVFFGVVNVLN